MGELQISVGELSLQMRQQDCVIYWLHWLHILAALATLTLLTARAPLHSTVQDWAVWSQRLQRLEQAALRQSEMASTTSHDLGVMVATLLALAPHTPSHLTLALARPHP